MNALDPLRCAFSSGVGCSPNAAFGVDARRGDNESGRPLAGEDSVPVEPRREAVGGFGLGAGDAIAVATTAAGEDGGLEASWAGAAAMEAAAAAGAAVAAVMATW